MMRFLPFKRLLAVGFGLALGLSSAVAFAQAHDEPAAAPQGAPGSHVPARRVVPANRHHLGPNAPHADHAPAAGHGGGAGHAAGEGAAAEQGGGEHGADHGGGHHGPAPFNFADFSSKTPPYLALVINFVVLFGAYYLLGRKPAARALVERRNAVAKEIEEAARVLKEAEERAKIYQAKIANLGSELENAKKALEEAGKGERDRILREAEERAARMKRDAEFLVQQEIKQMRQDLVREAVELAADKAEKLLAEKVTAEDHERLANDFLVSLASVKPGQARAPEVGGAS